MLPPPQQILTNAGALKESDVPNAKVDVPEVVVKDPKAEGLIPFEYPQPNVWGDANVAFPRRPMPDDMEAPTPKISVRAPYPAAHYHLSIAPLSISLANNSLLYVCHWADKGIDQYVERVNVAINDMYPLIEEVIPLVQRAASCSRAHVLEEFPIDQVDKQDIEIIRRRYEETLLKHIQPLSDMCWRQTAVDGSGRDLKGDLIKKLVGAIQVLVQTRREVVTKARKTVAPIRM